MNRVGHLACGQADLRIVGYGDDNRWEVHCTSCGLTERWTQSEWRTVLREPVLPHLITVADEN